MPSRLAASTMSVALRRVGEPAALPEIAAVEQQRAARARLGAQPVDQRLEMSEAAEPAVTVRGLGEIEIREGVREPGSRRNAEMLRGMPCRPDAAASRPWRRCRD